MRFAHRTVANGIGRQAPVAQLRLERLEARTVPSNLTVVNTLDHGDGSLRDTIALARPDDTIDFDPKLAGGTILLTTDMLTIDKDLSVVGLGADQLTVSAAVDTGKSVFNTNAANIEISGLTIANSKHGGVFNAGTLTLSDCTVRNNFSPTGGGIYNVGNMTIDNCLIINDSADLGGGIEHEGFLMYLTNTVVMNNKANIAGGGIGNTFGGSALIINNSAIIGNVAAAQDGGGIYNQGTAKISDSTVADNFAAKLGGGILNSDALSIDGCTISGNMADRGGGVFNYSTATFTNSTIANNQALNGPGGGITDLAPDGYMYQSNSTVAGNSSVKGGGGLSVEGGQPQLHNTLMALNSAPVGPDVVGTIASQGFNLIGDGSGAGGFVDSDLVGTDDNPIDPLLGALADNGGPTLTMALLDGSPAIDAGDSTGAPLVDQRGLPRDELPDIGAFEVQPSPAANLIPIPILTDRRDTLYDITGWNRLDTNEPLVLQALKLP
jgi:hypothetical protein